MIFIDETGMRQAGAEPSEPFLGFAPTFHGDASGARSIPEKGSFYYSDQYPVAEKIRNLPALSNEVEIDTIRGFLDAPESSVFKGDAANKATVFNLNEQGRLRNAKVLAFSTHGLVSGDFGLGEPALALAVPKELSTRVSEKNDGLLTASDIATLNIGADWVLLSACNTAAGAKPGAEGLSGLARGFFYAGARSLLVSHWRVRDDAATFLTTRTIEHLRKEPGISHARSAPSGRN